MARLVGRVEFRIPMKPSRVSGSGSPRRRPSTTVSRRWPPRQALPRSRPLATQPRLERGAQRGPVVRVHVRLNALEPQLLERIGRQQPHRPRRDPLTPQRGIRDPRQLADAGVLAPQLDTAGRAAAPLAEEARRCACRPPNPRASARWQRGAPPRWAPRARSRTTGRSPRRATAGCRGRAGRRSRAGARGRRRAGSAARGRACGQPMPGCRRSLAGSAAWNSC